MTKQTRPILVWLILVYVLAVSALWVISLSFLEPSMASADSAIRTGVKLSDYAASFVSMLLYLAAAVTLFLMRRLSLYLFVGAVVLEIALLVSGSGTRTEVMMLGGDSKTIVETVSIVISAALCIYVFMLTMSGRLR